MSLCSKMNSATVVDLVKDIRLPRMAAVRQKLDAAHIAPEDIPGVVFEEMSRKAIRDRIRPGMKVAITCGSRGVANIAVITRAIVDVVRRFGGEPFVFPAMGSHGGATAEGQREILAGYNVTEAFIGCPIRSCMEVKQVGVTGDGDPVFVDRYACEADAIILCGRIKPHSGFHGPYESGLMKMAVIGMGKQAGAEAVHVNGFSDMARLLQAFGKVVLENTRVICGVGIVENAFDETSVIRALTREEIYTEEPKLLKTAYEKMGRIFIDNIDVLVVDEIGKNISGDGMDPNIIGRYLVSHLHGGYNAQRIAALDLTEETHGSFVGMGNVDVTTSRAVEKMDIEATYPNLLTSTVIKGGQVPMFMPTDRSCIQAALKSCNYINRDDPRIIRIKNTQELEYIRISEALLPEARLNPNIEVVGEAEDWGFDEHGNLW